jgi:predicted nucleotidyltransferase
VLTETVPELPPLVRRTLLRLIRAFSPERILLFGSWAKGTMHAGSDVDLLIIAPIEGSSFPFERRARQLAADCFPCVDVLFATPAEITGAAQARSPFLQSILGSSIPVYFRSVHSTTRDCAEPSPTVLGLEPPARSARVTPRRQPAARREIGT